MEEAKSLRVPEWLKDDNKNSYLYWLKEGESPMSIADWQKQEAEKILARKKGLVLPKKAPDERTVDPELQEKMKMVTLRVDRAKKIIAEKHNEKKDQEM